MGELARQPGCPELPATPLELLTPRPNEGYTTFDKWILPVLGVTGGFLCGCAGNMVKKRPLWAGFQLHIILGGLGGYGMMLLRDVKFASRAETEEVYKDYIRLHPEDFPPYERKRYRDVYKPFFPVR